MITDFLSMSSAQIQTVMGWLTVVTVMMYLLPSIIALLVVLNQERRERARGMLTSNVLHLERFRQRGRPEAPSDRRAA